MPTTATRTSSTIIPSLRYRDAPAAIEWLCSVLGFARHAVYTGPENTISHAELSLEGGMLMLGSQKADEHASRYQAPDEWDNQETMGAYVVVADAEAVYEKVQAAKARVVRPLQSTSYGSVEFSVKDPEGHTWTVGTYNPWQVPE